jgi:hypothetical protein
MQRGGWHNQCLSTHHADSDPEARVDLSYRLGIVVVDLFGITIDLNEHFDWLLLSLLDFST